jgi:hypothetical protein
MHTWSDHCLPLQVLRLRGNEACLHNYVAPLPPITAPVCLETLTISLALASRSCATLAQLTSLRTLRLDCALVQVPPTTECSMKENADFVAFLRPLLKLPRVTIEWVRQPHPILLRQAAAN